MLVLRCTVILQVLPMAAGSTIVVQVNIKSVGRLESTSFASKSMDALFSYVFRNAGWSSVACNS